MKRSIRLLVAPVALLGVIAGCSSAPPKEGSKPQSVEEQIKSIEASDMPAPVKAKAIEEARAKQGQAAKTQ